MRAALLLLILGACGASNNHVVDMDMGPVPKVWHCVEFDESSVLNAQTPTLPFFIFSSAIRMLIA